jgi:hypothetical protein
MRPAKRVLSVLVIAFVLLTLVVGLWPTERHYDPQNEFRSRFTGHWQYFAFTPRWAEPESEITFGFD